MDTNETPEPYTAGDFGKDVAKTIAVSAAQTAVSIVITVGTLAAVGFIVTKLEERHAKKTLTEN